MPNEVTDKIKKLKAWLGRHKWSSVNMHGQAGAYMTSPVHASPGMLYSERDPRTGGTKVFSWESCLDFSLEGFGLNCVRVKVFRRKHYWKRDPSIPAGDRMGYRYVPSDEFGQWTDYNDAPDGYVPIQDFEKLYELLRLVHDEHTAGMPAGVKQDRYGGLSFIGVNDSYEKIAARYSNDRLRQERGWASSQERPDNGQK